MTRKKKTPGERIAVLFTARLPFHEDRKKLARSIDAAIRRAAATAWDEGYTAHQDYIEGACRIGVNLYRRTKR